MPRLSRFLLIPVLLATVSLGACASGPITKEASYPTKEKGTDAILYSDQKRETIWGGDETIGSKIFGKDDDKTGSSGGIGVNSFLWRAALDTISFMPVVSADPFGGVILTDWYENPETPGERFKMNVYILDKQLRADGVRVSVFKQKQEKNGWHDVKIPPDMATSIENTVLTRARELRVAQIGARKG